MGKAHSEKGEYKSPKKVATVVVGEESVKKNLKETPPPYLTPSEPPDKGNCQIRTANFKESAVNFKKT